MAELKFEHDKNLIEFLRLEVERLRRDNTHKSDFINGQLLAFDRAYNVAIRSNCCEWKV